MPLISQRVLLIATIIYLAIFVAAIVFAWLRKRKNISALYRRLWQKLASWAFSFSLIGLLLLFFRQQLVPYLGMRAWTMLWWLICAIWLIYIIKYWWFDIPRQKEIAEARKNFDKYLP